MEYETIGGKIKNTNDIVELRNLAVGDRFKTKSSKDTFEVTGSKCVWSRIGTSTRRCLNLTTGLHEWKQCRVNVYKL